MRVATLLVLVACAPPAKQFEIVRPLMLQRCVPQFTASSSTGIDVLVVDEPVELTFAGSARLDCEFGIREAESISAELIDDSSAPVEVQTKVERSGSNWSVKVSVTPRRTGALYLRLVAEPSIGVFTQTLGVVRLSPRTWERVAGRFCDGLIDVPFGEPLCMRDGQLEFAGRQVFANGLAATDSMLWVSTSQRVDGWRVDGGEAFKAVSVDFPLIGAIAARGRRLGVATLRTVTVVEEDGGLGHISLGTDRSAVHGLAFEDDDTLVVARGDRLDRVPLPAVGQTVSLPPLLDEPVFVRLGSEGLWSVDPPVLRLRRFDGGVAETSGSDAPPIDHLLLPDRVPLLIPGSTNRVFGVPVLTPDGGIAVDFVELPANTFPTWFTSRWLFARDSSTRELWRAPRAR